MLIVSFCLKQASAACPEAIFAFGASQSDTGNSQAAFPFQSSPQTNLPYGETFFKKPANRYSDGRVIVDFFAQALKIPLLSPSLQSVDFDFTYGVNFAFAGVMTQNNSYPQAVTPPFFYWKQLQLFRYFKERTLAAWQNPRNSDGQLKAGLSVSTRPMYFNSGLYFTTFGTNDFVVPLFNLGQTIAQVQSNVSQISYAMVANTEELYKLGAKTIMVFNVPPLGCYPAFLSVPSLRNESGIDEFGCLGKLNAAISDTNSQIRTGLAGLRTKYSDATIIYADFYTVLFTLVRNGTQHGFKEKFKACCGVGYGEYNLQQGVYCGATSLINGTLVKGESCGEPGSYVHWDGVHITDAAARFVARTLLEGGHTEPSFRLAKLCTLDYSQF